LRFFFLHRDYTQVVDSLPEVKRAASPQKDAVGGGLAGGLLAGKAGGGMGGLLGGTIIRKVFYLVAT